MTGEMVLHVGEEDAHQGRVAKMLTPQVAKSLMVWTPVSSKIILEVHNFTQKVINIANTMYKGFGCAVDEGKLTGWFGITSGVKQGCVMSGFLFLVVVD